MVRDFALSHTAAHREPLPDARRGLGMRVMSGIVDSGRRWGVSIRGKPLLDNVLAA